MLYILGGYCDGAVVDTVKSLDISTQTWSTLPSMREKRGNPGACMRGDHIVACGGWSGLQNLATCEQFDSTLQRWVIETQFIKIITHLNAQSRQLPPSFCPPSWSSLPQMKTPRENLALVCLPSGGGLVAIGGYKSKGSYIDVVEGLLGDSANNWRPLAPLPTPLHLSAAVLFRQRILVAGGTTTGGTLTSDMFAFDPPTLGGSGQWTCLNPKLPIPIFPVCVVAWGKEVFLVGKPLRVS